MSKKKKTKDDRFSIQKFTAEPDGEGGVLLLFEAEDVELSFRLESQEIAEAIRDALAAAIDGRARVIEVVDPDDVN